MTAPAGAAAPSKSRRGVIFTLLIVAGVLVFTVALFLLVLTSANISVRALGTVQTVDTITHQQTLAQRMAGDLLSLQRDADRRRPNDADKRDLLDSASRFDQTLAALIDGGMIDDPSGQRIRIEKLREPRQIDMARKVVDDWKPLANNINQLTGEYSRAALDQAVAAGVETTPHLVADLDALTSDVETTATNDVAGLGRTRNLVILVAVFSFVVIVGSLFQQARISQNQAEMYSQDLEQRNFELANSALELSEAKAGADLIMDTVRQGLALIDDKYSIQNQYSRELESILRMPDLAGYNFLNVLQRLLTERMYNTSKDYLALLFDRTRKERTVLKVNPLDEVEVNFPNPEGGFESKYLNFSFRRIVDGGEVRRVFVAISDITERVQLERQLRESEQRKEKQFELLLSILHVDPKLLDDFVATAQDQVQKMNDALRAQDFASAVLGRMDLLRQRLDVVFRCVHNIKGNAALLRLDYFQRAAESFEGKIVELRNRPALGGDDFLSIVIAQSELRADLEELQDLRGKLRNVQSGSSAPPIAARPEPVVRAPATGSNVLADLGLDRVEAHQADEEPQAPASSRRRIGEPPNEDDFFTKPTPSAGGDITPSAAPAAPAAPAPDASPFIAPYAAAPAIISTRIDALGSNGTALPAFPLRDELIDSLAQLASSVAVRYGSEVTLDATGFDTRSLPADRRSAIKDILIQLTRNSVTHGIEPVEERLRLGKPRAGTITIRPMADAAPGSFGFTFRDDGRGLDPARIRARAVAQGLVSREQAAAYDDSAVTAFIFVPAFSTAEEVTSDAGRGVGMNVVKEAVVDRLRGEILVSSETGSFCEFGFVIPITNQVAASNSR